MRRAWARLPSRRGTAEVTRCLDTAFPTAERPHAALATAAGPAGAASAARAAERILMVAVAAGRPPGLRRMEDVLLEYYLDRPRESAARSVALLDPVSARPDLTDTVRTHLGNGRNRLVTARLLGVHPNTVDNRLARFASLTGIDIATGHGAVLVYTATLLRAAGHG